MTNLRFRLVNHITLGLACVCLVDAEAPFLPGMRLALVPVLGLILAAFLAEGRWALPAWGANLLGLAIAAGTGAWLVWQVYRPGSWAQYAPMPAALVPHLGPLLVALLLVRLFRPRAGRDFWLLQGMGLLQVVLGCVLASGPLFGAWLAAYLASALSCLTLHYLDAPGSMTNDECLTTKGVRPSSLRPSSLAVGPWLLFPFSLRWAAPVGAAALVLFLLTPRPEGPGWDPFGRFGQGNPGWGPVPSQTGYRGEINLNDTGPVEVSHEIAFRVKASDGQGQPKLDLRADQRWRGIMLDRYEEGQWKTQLRGLPPRGHPVQTKGELPDLGPDQYFLTFTVDRRRAGGLFLADPILLPPGEPLPVAQDKHQQPAFFAFSGTVLPLGSLLLVQKEYVYRQVLAPSADPDRVPADQPGRRHRLIAQAIAAQGLALPSPAPGLFPQAAVSSGVAARARSGLPRYAWRLAGQGVGPDLEEWTARLLRRLAADERYGLSGEGLAPAPEAPDEALRLPESQWEPVARALTEYLAHSGDYTYTLDLRRQDPALDPVMDFLCNVKQGHCERYASALVLMLRALGVPARIVKGFRGAEGQGDGIYLVRQSQAHSWAEVLVPRPGADPGVYDWLSLDPTPDREAPVRPLSALARWWQHGWRSGQELWRELIVNYNANQQADLWGSLAPGRRLEGLWARAKGWLPALAALAAALAGAGLWLRLVRRRSPVVRPAQPAHPAASFYLRLVQLMAWHARLSPGPAQTPREFGAAAAEALRANPATRALAGLPDRVADLLYRVRFGGQALDEDEGRRLDTQLGELAAALKKPRRGGLR
jgi:hypothetical protein